jgi:protoporphyrinogen oxidase
VLEASDVVGGISRTVERDGWRFDIGGHRFFTKVPEVEALWHEILPDEEFLLRPRMSRIYYRGKLFDYPLKAGNALRSLGLLEAVPCVLSYALVRVRPPKDQSNFEGWVAARFGWRLYRIFFKTYTEKVWGVDATEIQADWAAQRIKNLSLLSAVTNALLPKRNQKEIASLIEEFQYPKLGPGLMWERCAEHVESLGGGVLFDAPVARIERDAQGATTWRPARPTGRCASRSPTSSPPCRSARWCARSTRRPRRGAGRGRRPALPRLPDRRAGGPGVVQLPGQLDLHPQPRGAGGRVQNFGSWSPFLVKDGRTCLGLEYFVNEGDGTWTMPDDELISLATKEITELGLVTGDVVEAGYVVRQPKAYPVYDEHYKRNVDVLRDWLARAVPNVHPVGRNGMHRYNNADHSMLTAMLTAQNILAGERVHDIWSVNVEEDYHEEQRTPLSSSSGTGRDAPVIPRDAKRPAA